MPLEKPVEWGDFDGPSIACWEIVKQIAFPPWALAVVGAILLFNLTAFVRGLLVIYVGDEYTTPAFSEQSFSQPRLY